MKTISATLQAHLQKTTTSLAMCWLITRVDGDVYAFTEHDVEFDYALDGGDTVTYRPESAFERSDISQASTLAVANMDVQGVALTEYTLNLPLMLEPDIRNGLFDFAELKIFLVNWADLTQADLPYFVGHLGEFMIMDGMYKFEVRSLTQMLTKRVTEVYSPDCRADLFDSRCTLDERLYREYSYVDTVVDNRRFTLPAGASERRAPLGGQMLETKCRWDDAGALRLLAGTTAEDGSPQRPILVSTGANLDAIRNDPSLHYALTADIDLTGGAYDPWTPIPNLRGGLDGRGHVIYGLHIDATAIAKGLFDNIDRTAYVRRLGIEEADFSNTSGTTITKAVGVFAGTCNGVILDCYSFNCLLEGGSLAQGGLCATLGANGALLRCWVGNIWEASGSSAGAAVETVTAGGILGDVYDVSDIHSNLTTASAPATSTLVTVLTTAEAQARANFSRRAGGPATAANSIGGFRFGQEWWTQRKTGSMTGGPNLTFYATSLSRPTSANSVLRSAGSWKTDGFYPGQVLTITGSVSNNGTFTVRRVSTLTLWIDRTQSFVAEGPVGAVTVSGAVVTTFPKLVTV